MAKILYFMTLVDRLGRANEEVQLPDDVASVRSLLILLRSRGKEWEDALQENKVNLTINKQFAALDSPLAQSDEIAIIPLRS